MVAIRLGDKHENLIVINKCLFKNKKKRYSYRLLTNLFSGSEKLNHAIETESFSREGEVCMIYNRSVQVEEEKKKTGTLKAGFLLVLSLVGNWCNKQHCTSYFPIIFYFIWSCAGLKLRIKGSSFIIQTSKTRIGTSDAAFQEKRTNCTWKTCAIHSSSSCTHFSSY